MATIYRPLAQAQIWILTHQQKSGCRLESSVLNRFTNQGSSYQRAFLLARSLNGALSALQTAASAMVPGKDVSPSENTNYPAQAPLTQA